MKKTLALSLLFFVATNVIAQAGDAVEMADGMRADGKIYVVVTVLSVVFIGLVIFLISIDRKVSRIEKEIGSKNR